MAYETIPPSSGGVAGVSSAVAGVGIGVSGATGAVTFTNTAAFTADTTVQLNNSTPAAVNAFRSVVSLPTATPASEQSAYAVTLLTGGAATQALYVRGDGRTVFGAPGAALDAGANSLTCIGAASVGSSLSLGMTTATASQTTMGSIAFYNATNPTVILSATNAASTTGGNLLFTFGTGFTLAATMSATGLAMANAKTVGLTNANVSINTGSVAITGATQNGVSRTGGILAVGTTDAQKAFFYSNSTVGICLGTDGTSIGFLAVAAALNSVAAQTIGAVTNSVTSGGSDGVIANYTDLTVYATDAAAIRNNIYQLARSVAQIATGLRNYGLGV